MGRMDKYHHQKNDDIKKEWQFSPRKERKKPQVSFEENIRKENNDDSHTKAVPSLKKQKKSKNKKKHRCCKWIMRFIIFCSLYSLGSFIVGHQIASSGNKQPVETFSGFKSSDGSHNILLIGNDSREGEAARADSMMVLQLDGPHHKPKIISFMRDTLVEIPGYGEMKLNAAYAYGGAELVRQTLNQNFGIDCKYYMSVNFESFEQVIDTLFPGGVKIDAEKDMHTDIEFPVYQGVQKMNGQTLLQYARFRMDEEGDFGRVRRQQQVMNAVFSQMKNPISLIKLPYAAGKAFGYASTDIPGTFILKNTFSILRGSGGVDKLTIPIDDSWSYGTTFDGQSVLVVNEKKNQEAIKQFLQK